MPPWVASVCGVQTCLVTADDVSLYKEGAEGRAGAGEGVFSLGGGHPISGLLVLLRPLCCV